MKIPFIPRKGTRQPDRGGKDIPLYLLNFKPCELLFIQKVKFINIINSSCHHTRGSFVYLCPHEQRLSTGGRVPPLPSQPLRKCCPSQSLLHAATALTERRAPYRRAVSLQTYQTIQPQLHITEVSSNTFKKEDNRYVSEKHSKRDGSELQGWEKMAKTTRNLCQFKVPWAE